MIIQREDLREKDFATEEQSLKPLKTRKTIGEEGSRKQILIVFLVSIALSAGFYLTNWRPELKFSLPEKKNKKDQVYRIVKPRSEKKTVEEAIGFKAEIKFKGDAVKAIEKIIDDQSGGYGIYAENLVSGEALGVKENEILTAASVIKLPILTAYYEAVDKGEIDPETEYSIKEQDRLVYGTGSMQNQPVGTRFDYRRLAFLAGKESDNMAAQLLVKFLGGEEKVNVKIRNWGLTKTDLKENQTTAKEIALLFKKIAKERLLKPDSKQELWESLTDTVLETRLPAGIPEGIRVRHKFGSEIGVVNDCGLVEAKQPYVVCILSTGVNDGQAEETLPKISRVIWELWGDN